jgi:hypothetical protein
VVIRRDVILFLLACTGEAGKDDSTAADDSGTDDSGTPACSADYTDALGADPDFSLPSGLFTLGVFPKLTIFSGSVADGPPLETHEESARSGSCRLVTYEPTTCTPPCEGTNLCLDGECRTWPDRKAVGPLQLSLGERTEIIEPDDLDGYYAYWKESFAGDVQLSAASFALGSCVPAPMVPTGDWKSLFSARGQGEDVTLAWAPSEPVARISLHMTTGIATHGGIAHAEIDCEGPDTGSLTLEGAFLDVLYSEGWSCGECGDNTVYRFRADGTSELRFVTATSTTFFFRP